MKLYYDFHIHSALSPCGDDDMTPNNIVNMSLIKGLDAIAVCDHNCTANLPAVSIAAQKAGILFLPGIEINTAEEVHVLAFFVELEQACSFGEKMFAALPAFSNNEEYFGKQLILNENDEVTGKVDKLLISALPYSLDECVDMITEFGGYAVPAHINKNANSILNNLGFIPANQQFKTVEVVQSIPTPGVELDRFNILHSSDAHFLEDISERKNFILVKNITIDDIVKTLFK